MPSRRVLPAAAALLAVGVLAGASGALLAQDDPVLQVDAVEVGPSGSAPPGGTVAAPQQVAALDRLEGTFERRGDDVDDFRVGFVELDLGPDEWLVTAAPTEDYDGDGARESVLDELNGLLGKRVVMLVRLDRDGDDADVFVLAGKPYRDTAGGPPPWQPVPGSASGPDPRATATREQVATAAAAAVGPGARAVEVDSESAGTVAWEVDVFDAAGQEHTVLLDQGGAVLDVRPED